MDKPALSHGDLDFLASSWDLSDEDWRRMFQADLAEMKLRASSGDTESNAKLMTVQEIATMFSRWLHDSDIPTVVRRPAEIYENRSMLEMIAGGEQERLLADLEKSFEA